jgi:hypothetical protein
VDFFSVVLIVVIAIEAVLILTIPHSRREITGRAVMEEAIARPVAPGSKKLYYI